MSNWMYLFLFVLLFLSCPVQSENIDPTVDVDCGRLEGKIIDTIRGDCNVYLGIPFAAPPVGQLRWKKPQPATCWSGVKVAKEFAPRCVQMGSEIEDPKVESEDCLYLNVMVPRSDTQTKALLPVMVFIHGGWLYYGSARDYYPEGICENIVARGVIVVTIQYRLGLYGMYSTGDSEAPGNFALWDQIESLRWVKKNILHFGGDPNKVTIFGESAGAKSVSYLTYIPIAKDLFQQSIQQSGSALAVRMKLNDRSVIIGKELAKAADCQGDSTDYTNCLRRIPTAQLQKIYGPISPCSQTHALLKPLEFTFIQDGELFTQDTFQELGTKKPTIIGVNSIEIPPPDVNCIPNAQSMWEETMNSVLPIDDPVKKNILKRMTKFVYIDSKGDFNNSTFVCQQVSKVLSDVGYHAAAPQEAMTKLASGNPVWVYHFDFSYETFFAPNYPFEKGATHAHELCYLFIWQDSDMIPGVYMCPETYEGENRRVADYMGEMWTNFAKTGNPSPSILDWPRFEGLHSPNTMHIRDTLKIENTFYNEITKFWYNLVPDIENDFISTSTSNGSIKNKINSLIIMFSFFIVLLKIA